MYIRQTCLLSFDEILEYQQESKLEKVFQQINVSKITQALLKPSDSKGPKGFDPTPMMYALLAIQLEKIATVKQLVSNLKQNPVLRYCCDFKVLGKVPSESTFSRFYSKLKKFHNKHLNNQSTILVFRYRHHNVFYIKIPIASLFELCNSLHYKVF